MYCLWEINGIDLTDQVCAMDITYIPVQGGYLYLLAVIHLYSKYVLNWSLSNAMTSRWRRQTLDGKGAI